MNQVAPRAERTIPVAVRIQAADPIHAQIQKQLEQAIRSGQLATGTKLPPSSEMVRQWGVNLAALQRAMDHLSAAGLIERKPGRGTFVRALQDKSVIGLVIGPSLLEESAHFFRAIARAIQAEVSGRGWNALLYDQLTFAEEETIAESKKRLLHDIRHHRFKGLILVGCSPIARKDFLAQKTLPVVVFGPAPGELLVTSDVYDFAYSAVRHLSEHGCKQIAYFRTFSPRQRQPKDDLGGLRKAAHEFGAKLSPHSIYQLRVEPLRSYDPERSGFEQMIEFIELWRREGMQPDGLIVTDDVIMRGVARALAERGIRVPAQMRVVTQANENMENRYAVPVTRYIVPIRQAARELVSLLWKKTAGEPLPEMPVLVRGRIEEESNSR